MSAPCKLEKTAKTALGEVACMDKLVRISDAATLGLHAMGYMTRFPAGEAISVGQMADDLAVSRAHLSKVLQRLTRSGLIRSRRGPHGGFYLADEAQATTLLQIYEAIDGPLPTSTCLLEHERCPAGTCVMGDVLHTVYDQVHRHLANTRLAELAQTPSFRRFGPA